MGEGPISTDAPLWDDTIPPPDLSRWEEVRRLTDALFTDLDRLVDRVTERLREEIPFYAEIPLDDVRPRVSAQLAIGLVCLRAPRLPSPDELEIASEIVEVRARQGLPLEGMLRAYRLSTWEAWRHGLELAREHGIGPATMLEAAHLIWRLHDVLTSAAAVAHRAVDIEAARRAQHRRDEFLRRLLFGTLPAAELRMNGPAYGIALDRTYLAFRARPAADVSVHEMEREILAEARGVGLVGLVEGDVAGILPRRPAARELSAFIGLGPPAELDALEPSFSVASRALETAISVGRCGVFALEDLPLAAMILSEGYIGENLEGRYLRPLEALGSFGDELARTVRVFLAHGMRHEETARALYVHPNTLRYRLTRYREITGADLGTAPGLFLVWWALERSTMCGLVRNDQSKPSRAQLADGTTSATEQLRRKAIPSASS